MAALKLTKVNEMFKLLNFTLRDCHLRSSNAFSPASLQFYRDKTTLQTKLGIPEAPKRPLTPFFRFMKSVRLDILRKNPAFKMTDVVKEAAGLWKTADVALKEKYTSEYDSEIKRYQTVSKDYHLSLTDTQRQTLSTARKEQMVDREKRKFRKKLRELGRPKRPPSSFAQFCKSKAGERGDVSAQDWMKRLSARWNAMSEDDKAPYAAMHNKALQEYKRDIAKWETQMIHKGQEDVLRMESQIAPKK